MPNDINVNGLLWSVISNLYIHRIWISWLGKNVGAFIPFAVPKLIYYLLKTPPPTTTVCLYIALYWNVFYLKEKKNCTFKWWNLTNVILIVIHSWMSFSEIVYILPWGSDHTPFKKDSLGTEMSPYLYLMMLYPQMIAQKGLLENVYPRTLKTLPFSKGKFVQSCKWTASGSLKGKSV